MWKVTLLIAVIVFVRGNMSDQVHVVDLKEHDFDYILGKGHEVWGLLFYIPYDAKSEATTNAFKQAAKMMVGLAKFGSINVERYPVMAYRFDIKQVPSIVFIDRDAEEVKYYGELNDTAIIDFAGKLLMRHVEYGLQKRLSDNRLVKELTDEEVRKHGKNGTKFWLIAFYNSKDNVTRVDFVKMVEYAATNLNGAINVGAFDITKRTTPYMYDEIPTVILFHGKKSDRYEIEYNDEMYGNKLVDFALARVKTPQIQELWTENILTEMCQLKKYCMITFIPAVPKCDTRCKDQYIAVLSEVAEHYKTIQAGWAIIRHRVMKTAEKLLEINDDTEFPLFIMVDVKTLRSEYLTDKFNTANIISMVKELTEGEGFTGRTLPIFDYLSDYRPWLRDEL